MLDAVLGSMKILKETEIVECMRAVVEYVQMKGNAVMAILLFYYNMAVAQA